MLFTIGGLILIVAGWYFWNQRNLKQVPVKPDVCKQCGHIPQIFFEPKERAVAIRRGEMCCCPGELFFDDHYLELDENQVTSIRKFWKGARLGLTQDIDAFCLVFPSAQERREKMAAKARIMENAEEQLD